MSPPRPLPTTPASKSNQRQRPSAGRERGKSFEVMRGEANKTPGLSRSPHSERDVETALGKRTNSSDSQYQPLSLPVNPPSFSRSSSQDTTHSTSSSTGGFSSYINTQAHTSLALPPRRGSTLSSAPLSASPPSGSALLPSLLSSSPQPPLVPPLPKPSGSAHSPSSRTTPLPSPSSSRFPQHGPSTPSLPTAPTPDSPTYRFSVVSLSLRLGHLKTHVKSVQRSAARVSELLTQLGEAEEELASGMRDLAGYMEEPTTSPSRGPGSGGGLKRAWGDDGVCGRRRKERREEREVLERTVVGPLRAYYEGLKETEKEKFSRKGWEEESKSFLTYTAKYLSSPANKDSAKLDAAFRTRTMQWDFYRFDVLSHLLNLTLGPTFETLRVHLLTFPSQLLTFTSPSSSVREDLERTLAEASERNFQVQEWWDVRQAAQRSLQEGGFAVEDDWENLDGTALDFGASSHERKRDRLGSKLRAAFNLPSSSTNNASGGGASNSLAESLTSPFRNFGNGNRSASPTNVSPNFTPAMISNPISPPLILPDSFASGLPLPIPSPHPQQSTANPEAKRPNRHSIQVMPKSYSTAGLSASAGAGGGGGFFGGGGGAPGGGSNPLKGIRDLDPRWADLREKEGRKKEGYLWCAGGSGKVHGGGGEKEAKGGWERCWCEVKQSQLIEHRAGSDGVGEFASTTDLMFASAREARKSDRRFVIELITRKSTRRFQATSEVDMNRWLAALGNAIEASINGTASVRGSFSTTSPLLGSSVDDLGLIKTTSSASSHLGHGLPSHHEPPASSNPSSGFPAFRAWGNPLSRKTSTRKTHATTPSEGGAAMMSSSSHSSPGGGTSPGGISSKDYHYRHRLQATSPTSPTGSISTFKDQQHVGAPTFYLTSPSPASTPPPSAKKRSTLQSDPPMSSATYPYLAQVPSPSRLSMTLDALSESEGSSRRSSFLGDDLDMIERRVNELALGRAMSEGSSSRGGEEEDGNVTLQLDDERESKPLPSIGEISRREGNASCVDCGRTNPRWATIAIHDARLVAFMCIECSGIHRSLGSHISKVRSVDLDNWKSEDILAASRTGNVYVNRIFLARRPTRELTAEERRDLKGLVQAKYVEGRWRR